ncbi:MAG: fumarylacetoacetate hydrolase family protein [Rhodospirillaceae bacterium]|nr:fumarylacetoacetate hydrolase family protein [Rhodospirillaceae bacterium]
MTTAYRLLTYRRDDGKPAAGVLVGEHVYPAPALLAGVGSVDTGSLLGLLQAWDTVHPRLMEAAANVKPADGAPLAKTALLAPLLYPTALFCAGANYWDHLEEMARAGAGGTKLTGPYVRPPRPAEPWFFVKTSAHSVIGPGAPIHLPAFSKMVDWEAEIGVVIGRAMRDLPVERALEAVAGYTIVNDLSARDHIKREGSMFVFDWVGQKCFDGSAPMGPYITPAEFVPPADDIPVKLSVNGVVKQNSNSSLMVHSIAEQVAYLSRHVTLRPGDVIATGTPAGVGLPKGEFLKPGDEVTIEIGGCGTLVNPVALG